jgi:large subunit ribosomal protein L21
MSQYIVVSGSKQYVVSTGEVIVVDRLKAEVGSNVELPVVFSFGGSTPKTCKTKVLEHLKGEKIRVVKFRNKQNYHKVTGFRAYQTKLEIL